MPVFYRGGILSALRKRVTDTFVRANRADLGRGLDGSLWQTIRSGLRIDNNRAAATNPTEFPISTVDMPSGNVTIDLGNIAQGGGAALWVQSSEDWWAVTVGQDSRNVPQTTATEVGTFSYSLVNTSFSFNTVTNFNYTITGGGNAFSGIAGFNYTTLITSANWATANFRYTAFANFRYTISGTSNFSYTIYVGSKRIARTEFGTFSWTRNATGTFSFRATGTYQAEFTFLKEISGFGFYAFSGTNAVWSYIEQGTTTSTVFVPAFSYIDFAPYTYSVIVPARTVTDQKISVWQSIAGNISLITSQLVSSLEVARSLRVRLSQNQITSTAYSDPNLVQQIGENLVYTATGAEVNTRFGLTLAPSTIGQGSTAASTVSIRTS
jgi:hypothetical protein